MSRPTILTFAALTIALGAFGCGGARTDSAAVVELRAALTARDADTVLLRLGVPEGWKTNQDASNRLPGAAIEKPKGSGDCRLRADRRRSARG